MKLTPARKRALEWYGENDGSRDRPEWLTTITVNRLCGDGLLRREYLTIGRPRIFITPAGRNALDKEWGDG